MTFYLILILLSLFLYVYYPKSSKAALFFIVILILLTGLRRNDVGTDTDTYVRFLTTGNYNVFIGEFLFIALFYLTSFIQGSYTVFLLLVSSLIFIPTYMIVRKGSPFPMISITVLFLSPCLFFPESMNTIRQTIAASFILCSIYFYSKDDYIRTAIFIIVSILFHLTSIIIVPILILSKFTYSKKVVYVLLSLSIVLGFTGLMFSDMFKYVNVIMGSMNNEMAENFNTYGHYLDRENNINLNAYIFEAVPMIVLLLLANGLQYKGNSERVFFNVFFMGVVILNIVFFNIKCGFRIPYGPLISQIIVFAYLYRETKLKQKLNIYISIMGFFFIYYYAKMLYTTSIYDRVVPYNFFFQ